MDTKLGFKPVYGTNITLTLESTKCSELHNNTLKCTLYVYYLDVFLLWLLLICCWISFYLMVRITYENNTVPVSFLLKGIEIHAIYICNYMEHLENCLCICWYGS